MTTINWISMDNFVPGMEIRIRRRRRDVKVYRNPTEASITRLRRVLNFRHYPVNVWFGRDYGTKEPRASTVTFFVHH